jgi:hypothetical protein
MTNARQSDGGGGGDNSVAAKGVTICCTRAALPGTHERVGETQLDECLAGHADSSGFAIDCTQQVNWKVDVHALNFTARPRGVWQIEMGAQVFACIVHLIQPSGAKRLGLRGTALLRLSGRGGPR